MNGRVLLAVVAALAGVPAPSPAQALAKVNPKLLRVCADPDDMPFSNDKRQGFDNKIAELIANDLGDSLTFTFFRAGRGFIRSTLRAGDCDVVLGVPKGYDLVAATNPYYRSNYNFVSRRDRRVTLASLDDQSLSKMKIGISMMGDDYVNTPPGQAIAARGWGQNLVGFSTYYSGDTRPEDIMTAVEQGKVDVAIVWGPIAGYFAMHSPVPLDLAALPDSDKATGFPLAYDVVMGVRRGDRLHLSQLNDVIARRKADIAQILKDFGVPTVAEPPAAANSTN
jgi:quinoprotein dehydrogenase-associated probable ABC transporter substrate-binding protein